MGGPNQNNIILAFIVASTMLCYASQHAAGAGDDDPAINAAFAAGIGATLPADPILRDDSIKCSTCLATINAIWNKAYALRLKCDKRGAAMHSAQKRAPEDENGEGQDNDDGDFGGDGDGDCRGDSAAYNRVRAIVESVCDELPHTHEVDNSGPKFKLTQNPTTSSNGGGDESNMRRRRSKYSPEILQSISNSCKRWVHERHTIDRVAKIVYGHMEGQEEFRKTNMYLRRRFCFPVCGGRKHLKRLSRREAHLYHTEIEEDFEL